ncbi:MAG: thioredoxin-dependent thiol peroxidase [Candidatus Wallbacteria bacterium]|nr:thioredoxin-dependent thiol peroxidase [Candidatus Wallbacteria bacterium]
MLKVGDKAPGFQARTEAGEEFELSDFRGKTVVLYFYPKDDTPGCTKEACDFRDSYEKLLHKGAVLLGVSADDARSHGNFREKYDLPFTLIADEDHSISEAYGVWQEKKMYGKSMMGIVRTTYLIDPKGNIAHVFAKVKVEGHIDEVLAKL